MSKTQSQELPKPSSGSGADKAATEQASGLPAQDDRLEAETAAGRHEGTEPPQRKTD